MTTTVVTRLAALLGDIDRSRYIWRDGRRVARRRQRGWCCWEQRGDNDARR